jgi:hypothetical protein
LSYSIWKNQTLPLLDFFRQLPLYLQPQHAKTF